MILFFLVELAIIGGVPMFALNCRNELELLLYSFILLHHFGRMKTRHGRETPNQTPTRGWVLRGAIMIKKGPDLLESPWPG